MNLAKLEKKNTYPSFTFDILQLSLRTFADALATPELQPYFRVSIRHGSNRQEISQYRENDIVPATRKMI